MNFASCDRVAITGNTSIGDYDPLAPAARVTRNVVTIDSGCTHVRVGDNSFEPGMSGVTVSDAAADTYIAASIDGDSPRKTLNGTVNWAPGTLNPGTGTSTTVTVTGARGRSGHRGVGPARCRRVPVDRARLRERHRERVAVQCDAVRVSDGGDAEGDGVEEGLGA